MGEDGEPRQYIAFISYAHADNREQGRRWAEWIHQSLETYRVPKDLIGRPGRGGKPIPRSLFPVFRDEEELAAADNLPARIEEALTHSTAVIAICSPHAAQSPWVARELAFYQQLGRGADIFALIVDGEPMADEPAMECFPEPLRGTGNGHSHPEMIGADVRPEGAPIQGFTNAAVWRQMLEESTSPPPSRAQLRERERRYADQLELACHKLLAGLLGVELDQLRRRAAAARARRARIIGGMAAGVALLMSGLAIVAWQESRQADRSRVRAEQERDHANTETKRADEARHEAEGLIGWVQSDVRGSLLSAGRADVLSELNQRIEDYFRAHPPTAGDAKGLVARANELSRKASEALQARDFQTATNALREEMRYRQQVHDLSPDDELAASSIVNCLSMQGSVAMAGGHPAEAIAPLRAALAAIDQYPGKDAAAMATARRGILLVQLSQALDAGGRGTEATEVRRKSGEEVDNMFGAVNKMLEPAPPTAGDSKPDEMDVVMQRMPEIFGRLQQAFHDKLSFEQQRDLFRDLFTALEQVLTFQEKNRATDPDDAAALQASMAGLDGLSERLAGFGMREEAIRCDRIQLRYSRPLVHANPQDGAAVLRHADLVLRHVGLLCAKQASPPPPVNVTTELSGAERNTLTLLVAEARQWLQGLSAADQARPEWKERAQKLQAWYDVLTGLESSLARP